MNLNAWFQDLATQRSIQLTSAVRIEGTREKHLGPRCEFGRVVFDAVPSESFRVSNPLENLSEEAQYFLRAAVFGVLDVVLTEGALPLRDFALHVVAVQIHPVDSSLMAFRWAGRDAGRRLLQHVRVHV